MPTLHSVAPNVMSRNIAGFQLTLNGQGFTEASAVNWNGSALPTTYVDSTVLTAIVPATNLANSGTVSLTVTNPPPGGGTSTITHFTVTPLAALISFSSSAVTFPTQKVGTTSAVKTIAVQNPGTASLTISSIQITGPGATSFHQTNNCGSTLAAGANCTLSVTFKPTSVGSLTASVTVSDSAAGSPQAISLAGTGD